MSRHSDIEWTDHTWPITNGCRRVSPGCGKGPGEGGCYAERLVATRLKNQPKYAGLATFGPRGPAWTGEGRIWAPHLDWPLKWKGPARVFVANMGDLFFEEISNEEIAAVFGIMASCPTLTFQVLTKRARRMWEWFEWMDRQVRDVNAGRGAPAPFICLAHAQKLCDAKKLSRDVDAVTARPWPLPNVWLGCSVENQKYADERITDLLRTPAAVRFLSVEPLLSAVNLRGLLLGVSTDGLLTAPSGGTYQIAECQCGHGHGFTRCSNTGGVAQRCHKAGCECSNFRRAVGGDGIHMCIVGGESGPGARPFDLAWARSLRDQCKAAGVAYFLKQCGANAHQSPESAELFGSLIDMKHSKGGDIDEFPSDLRIREFPAVAP